MKANSTQFPIRQRQALQTAINTGRLYASRLKNNDMFAKESEWQDAAALSTWGWTSEESLGDSLAEDLQKVLEDVVNSSSSSFSIHRDITPHGRLVTHDNLKVVDGTTFPASGARFRMSLVPGVLFAKDSRSPRHAGGFRTPPVTGPWPKLEHWSDIALLEYQKLFSGTDLTSVVHLSVTNSDATHVISAMRHENAFNSGLPAAHIPFADRKIYRAGERYFYALLGVPKGRIVVYLLLEHGERLGRKPFVSEIQLWWEHDFRPIIWYRIENAAETSDRLARRRCRSR